MIRKCDDFTNSIPTIVMEKLTCSYIFIVWCVNIDQMDKCASKPVTVWTSSIFHRCKNTTRQPSESLRLMMEHNNSFHTIVYKWRSIPTPPSGLSRTTILLQPKVYNSLL
jgi:hypothetical protein